VPGGENSTQRGLAMTQREYGCAQCFPDTGHTGIPFFFRLIGWPPVIGRFGVRRYELRDSTPSAWLALQLLPPAKPRDLVISRITVRLHRFVGNPEMAWVTGVLFQRGSTAVLAELLATGSEIELRARGPEGKELLSVIAADLDALNESFRACATRSTNVSHATANSAARRQFLISSHKGACTGARKTTALEWNAHAAMKTWAC
jgi:hypothetical protein